MATLTRLRPPAERTELHVLDTNVPSPFPIELFRIERGQVLESTQAQVRDETVPDHNEEEVQSKASECTDSAEVSSQDSRSKETTVS